MIHGYIKYTAICFLFVFSQQAFPQYPKRANLAIIGNDSLSDFLLLSKCAKILNEEGYQICTMNVNSLILTTNSYPVNNLPVLIYYKLKINGTTVMLHGYIMDNRDFESMGLRNIKKYWKRSAYRSLNGSMWKTGFEDMIIVTEKIRSRIYGKVTWHIEENFEL